MIRLCSRLSLRFLLYLPADNNSSPPQGQPSPQSASGKNLHSTNLSLCTVTTPLSHCPLPLSLERAFICDPAPRSSLCPSALCTLVSSPDTVELTLLPAIFISFSPPLSSLTGTMSLDSRCPCTQNNHQDPGQLLFLDKTLGRA